MCDYTPLSRVYMALEPSPTYGNLLSRRRSQQIAPCSTSTEPRPHWSEYRAICLGSRHLVSRHIACLLPDRLAAAVRSQTWFPFFASLRTERSNCRTIHYTQSSMVRFNKDALRNTQLSFYWASKSATRAEPNTRPLTRPESMAATRRQGVGAFVSRSLTRWAAPRVGVRLSSISKYTNSKLSLRYSPKTFPIQYWCYGNHRAMGNPHWKIVFVSVMKVMLYYNLCQETFGGCTLSF